VYEIDRCTFIAYQWDALFHLKDIMTPLPRPLEEYTLVGIAQSASRVHVLTLSQGLVTKADDVRIGSVLSEPARAPNLGRFTDFLSLRIRALTLLSAAIQLRQCEPEDPMDAMYQYEQSGPPSPGRFGSGRTAAHETNPIAFKRTKAAIDRFCRELPECYALPWADMDEGEDTTWSAKGRVSKEAAVIVRAKMDEGCRADDQWLIVGDAYIHLWNLRTLSSPNVKALLVAKRMASMMAVYASIAVRRDLCSRLDAFR
jgi:hypothetical protein